MMSFLFLPASIISTAPSYSSDGNIPSFLVAMLHSAPLGSNLTLFKRIYNIVVDESRLDSARFPPQSPHITLNVFRSCSVKLQCPRNHDRKQETLDRPFARKQCFPKMEFARSFTVRRSTKQRDRFRKLQNL